MVGGLMGYNSSIKSFEDVRAVLDEALMSPTGKMSKQPTRAAAINLRARFNHFRSIDRRENKRVYPEDHHLYNRSVYDVLVLQIPPKGTPDDTTLYIRKRSPEDLQFSDIPEIK
jgi:hypothetical protein